MHRDTKRRLVFESSLECLSMNELFFSDGLPLGLTHRCKLVRVTESPSRIFNLPIPAEAMYNAHGDPSPPAPTRTTHALFNRRWPSTPIYVEEDEIKFIPRLLL